MAYEPKPFPKMKYSATEAPRTVKDEKEESQLEGEWHDSPADVNKPKPETSKIILSEVPQKNGDSATLLETAADDDESDDIIEGVTPQPAPAIKPKAGKAK